METLANDVRYALRALRRARGFTLIALLTLALGISANTAMFSVVNGVLLKPLPFPDPDRLMSIRSVSTKRGTPVPMTLSYPDFTDYRSRNGTFEHIASYYDNDFALSGQGDAVQLRGQVVGTSLFQILRVQPVLGRAFVPEEEQPGHHAAILSHTLWTSRFHSQRDVIGRAIQLGGDSYTVVGVAPPGFQFPVAANPTDVWVSPSRDAEVDTPGEQPANSQRGAHFLRAIGRLKAGVEPEQAQADLSTIAMSLAQQFPDSNRYVKSARVETLLKTLVGDTQAPLAVLLVAVGCVLLIGCANIANLMLARASGRAREIAVRAALGASRMRIVRQLITESLLLSAGGAILGAYIATWEVAAVVKLYPENLPRMQDVGIDARVLLFTVALALVSGLLFGLVPALRASRPNLSEAMREGGRGTIGDAKHTRLRSGLVVAETAIGVMLLIASGLLVRSLNRLSHVDLGFNPGHVLTADFSISQTRYKADQQDRFYTELLTKIRALPGVTAASATGQLPLANDGWTVSFDILERRLPKSEQPSASFYDVSPGFFEAMQIPLVAGRTFDERDTRASTPVMIINREFAKKFFPNEDPIGKMIEIGADEGNARKRWKTREIVGVVGDIRSSEIGAAPRPAYFVPFPQLIWGAPTLIVRTAADPHDAVTQLRTLLSSMDPEAPLFNVKTIEDYLALTLGRARFQTVLLGLFAGIALLLTAVGLYGVVAYSVGQRTHEIGVRMALGASRSDVLRMVLNRGFVLTVGGIGLGVLGAATLARFVESLLYQIPARDPLTYSVVCVTLLAVAMVASYVPALRAARVDPMVALRCE